MLLQVRKIYQNILSIMAKRKKTPPKNIKNQTKKNRKNVDPPVAYDSPTPNAEAPDLFGQIAKGRLHAGLAYR